MGGWIKLHRQITESDLWDDKPFSKGQAWIDLLILANYEDTTLVIDGKQRVVKRGEYITSLVKLSKRWGWSRHKVSNFLDELEKGHRLEQKRDTKRTYLKVLKYSVYQEYDYSRGTSKGQQKDTKEEIKKYKEKKKGFSLVEQHDYDFEDLERKLLKGEG